MEVKEILEQRQETYGDYCDVAKTSQYFKATFRDQKKWNRLSFSQKESIDMIVSKVARILNGDPTWLDSWYDIIGYSQLVLNQNNNNMDTYEVDILGFIYKGNLVLTKNFLLMDSLLQLCISRIIKNLLCAVDYPNNITPWQNIKDVTQDAICILEEQGETRIQR